MRSQGAVESDATNVQTPARGGKAVYKKVMRQPMDPRSPTDALPHAKKTLAGLLVGGVTHRLLPIAPCPVLAVPPDHGSDA